MHQKLPFWAKKREKKFLRRGIAIPFTRWGGDTHTPQPSAPRSSHSPWFVPHFLNRGYVPAGDISLVTRTMTITSLRGTSDATNPPNETHNDKCIAYRPLVVDVMLRPRHHGYRDQHDDHAYIHTYIHVETETKAEVIRRSRAEVRKSTLHRGTDNKQAARRLYEAFTLFVSCLLIHQRLEVCSFWINTQIEDFVERTAIST